MKTNCLHCGLEFNVKPSEIKRGGGKFCSKKCSFASRKPQPTKSNCIICGSEFLSINGRKTCSAKCSKTRRLSTSSINNIRKKLCAPLTIKCKRCNKEFDRKTRRQKVCPTCKNMLRTKCASAGGKATIAKQITTSKYESILANIIENLTNSSLNRSNKSVLDGLEIDILIDGLAIEYNGPWHYRQIMGNLGSIKNRDRFKQKKLNELGYEYHPVMWGMSGKDNQKRLEKEAFFIIEKLRYQKGELTPFYFPYDATTFNLEFERLKKTSGSRFLCCIQTLEFYFKHLWFMKTNKACNSIDHWNMYKDEVIYNREKYSNTSPRDLRRYYKLNYMAPTIFYDSLAKNLVRSVDGNTVIDPFAGFGSRMLGVSSTGKKYVGVDLNSETANANTCLASDLGLNAEIIYGDSTKIELEGDILITSPPYFNLDDYETGKFKSKIDFLEFINKVFTNFRANNYIIDFKDGEITSKDLEKALPFHTKRHNVKIGGGHRESSHIIITSNGR